MKTVILLRHAKSSWDNVNLADHERPLNKRGNKDAPKVGEILGESFQPDLVLCSTSRRTLETYKHIKQYLGEHTFEERRSLYHASSGDLLDTIKSCDDQFDCLLIIAHNPGITDAFYRLCNVRIDNVPTAGVGIIRFKTNSFQDIEMYGGKLAFFTYPKGLD